MTALQSPVMNIPITDYGYWVEPGGTFHAVASSEMHVGFAGRILGRPGGGEGPLNNDHRIELRNRGWTRVAVHSRRLIVQLPCCNIDAAVLLELNNLIWKHHREAIRPIHIQDPLTGLDAGGKSARPGDPGVLATWRAIARRRGVRVTRPVTQSRQRKGFTDPTLEQ